MRPVRIHSFILLLTTTVALSAAQPPNVVVVITDDQGYGDLGFTGNPVIKTPHLDELAGESVWLEDFHVAPSCSPTRSAMLTARWTNRTGVWHTFFARAMMYEDEVTIADHFQAAGYGDCQCAPPRQQDKREQNATDHHASVQRNDRGRTMVTHQLSTCRMFRIRNLCRALHFRLRRLM